MKFSQTISFPGTPAISHPLKKHEVVKYFCEDAVYLYGKELVPEHRILERFGEYLAPWLLERRRGVWSAPNGNGYIPHQYDKHYVFCGTDDEHICLYTLKGFEEIVNKVNSDLLFSECLLSDARLAILDAEDAYNTAEAERDAEKKRKAAERRAKAKARKEVSA